MRKRILVTSSLLVMGTSAMALDVQGFLGVGAGISLNKIQGEGKANYSSGETEKANFSETESSALAGIKGGVILGDSHRLALNYNPAFHSNATIHNILASYDYLIPVPANDRVKLFVGVHAGVAKFDGKDDLSGIDATGFAYGAQFGYVYDITKNIEFEFGVMYTKHTADKEFSGKESWGSYKEKYELKHSISTLVGINYKF